METNGGVRQWPVRYLCGGVAIAGMLAVSPTLVAQRPATAMEPDQVPIDYVLGLNPTLDLPGRAAGFGFLGSQTRSSVVGVESLANFSGFYSRHGRDSFNGLQITWPYTLVGNPPSVPRTRDDDDHYDHDRDQHHRERGRNEAPAWERDWDDRRGHTTWIDAPIIPVNVDLRNADGSPRFVNGVRLYSDATRYVDPVLKSPVFAPTQFDTSNRPTQYTDAIHRAQFYSSADEDWHTMLRPQVKPARTIVLKTGQYAFALNSDGTCCAYILAEAGAFQDALMPVTPFYDLGSVMLAAERAGDIHPTDISTFLLPNTFLYLGSLSNCCVLGFHSYDLQEGDAANGHRERRFVMNYSSWISPGVFRGFADITALSHEMAEIFNNPFVSNASTWWIDTFTPYRMCQNNLEVADPLETLADPSYPMTIDGFTYHPQNVVLLPWFAGERPSTAYHGAYSFPDVNLVRIPSYSLSVNCLVPVDGYPYTPLPN